ncbi:MAG TPA: OB-fold nucleic acid binding domain-containing protein [Candidatus Nanoarchaeia archaeon]|nr:OB-fold nucleic acid binding domain-containing protein [Candidatus Nanoarchaeia archaeon]
MVEQFKRNPAYKHRIGQLLGGKPVQEGDRLKHIEIDNKSIIRVNLIANITDKFVQEGEKKYASLTMDDGTGQIRLKFFGEDIEKCKDLNQGDTLLVIGLLRSWNNELYITPEIIKKKEPSYLLVRKLEVEADAPKQLDKETLVALKDKIVSLVKEAEKDGGIQIEKIITDLKESPEVINNEIKRLLEDGVAYEPRPGKLRYLGQ